MLTGGGVYDWDDISKFHVEMYRKYNPINHDDVILEVGSGVGRDAIQLTEILSEKGKYTGFDIIKPSIEWSKQNISKKHRNFSFHYYDINSQWTRREYLRKDLAQGEHCSGNSDPSIHQQVVC